MNTENLRAAIVACTALMAACAPVPKIDLPADDRNAVVEATTTWGTGEAAWPTAGWWSRYEDPVLSSLMKDILVANPSIALARAHASASAAVAEAQASSLRPHFGIRVAPGRQQISANGMFPAPFGGQTFTLLEIASALTYRLDLTGVARAQVGARVQEAAAAREEAARAAEAVAATTARVYFELAAAIADRESLAHIYQQVVRIRAIADARADAGLDAAAAAHHTAAETEAFVEQLAAADERIARAKEVLAALAGQGPDAMQGLQPKALAAAHSLALPKDMRLGLLARRADVRAARDRVAAVAYEQVAAHRAYLPDLEFNANFGLQSRTAGRLFESGSHEWSAGPALSLPIFDGGQRAAAVRIQDAQYAAMRADYQATVIRAVDEVSRALSGRTANAASLAAVEKAKDADVLAMKSVERRYAAGISAETELHAAQIHVLEREREIIRLVARAKTLDVDLIEALGGTTREEKAK